MKLLFFYNEFKQFVNQIYQNRDMLFDLAKNDFKSKFASSFFGIIWAFIQPLVTILVFWLVFQLGFKTNPVDDFPFVLWFSSSYIAWVFFSDVLNAATNCLNEYSYLVKKIVFRTSLLPLVKIISSWFVHIVFVGFVYLIFVFYGLVFSIYNLQIVYYMFALIYLLLGLSWLFSAIAVFFKDMSQLIMIMLQIGFWMVPIFWLPDTMTVFVLTLLKINPVYYVIEGYRDSLVSYIWFWEKPIETIYFWFISSVIFFLGPLVYRKLRPHFADVL